MRQVWALGFMYAVETWPDDWLPPRDPDAARMLDDALVAIVVLTEDEKRQTLCVHVAEDGPPSVSEQRLNDLGAAIWAVYDLRQLWKSLGPRIETVRKQPEPGRNDHALAAAARNTKSAMGLEPARPPRRLVTATQVAQGMPTAKKYTHLRT